MIEKFGISQMISNGSAFECCMTESKALPEHGVFDTKEQADAKALQLGENYFAVPVSVGVE